MNHLLSLLLLLFALPARAEPSFDLDAGGGKHHVSADRTLYHTKEKVHEAFGHVVVSSRGERLSADYVWIDTTNNELRAKGNVVFVNRDTTIQSAELHYNLITGMGEIFYGRVSNDMYTLRGQLIRRVAQDHFLTSDGEYTTCKDCPESWKFVAKDVDFTVDGYAFMDSVYVQVKDVPSLYIPYLVLPVKSRRQSGLLFPRMGGGSNHGFFYIQPFFLAIDDQQDATVALGKYSAQGKRYEFEYRYKFAPDVDGTVNVYYTNDKHYQYTENRYAVKATNEWNLARFANIRWRVNEISDQDYLATFPEDVPGLYYPNLESNFIWEAPYDDFFISAEATRYRNLLYAPALGFDGGTVQDLPSVFFGIKERKLGPFSASIYGRYDNFTRGNGPFLDTSGNGLYDPSTDTIREAQRFHYAPALSLPFRVGKALNLTPSIEYNENDYIFPIPGNAAPRTSTRYLLTKLEASTVIERVYGYDGEKVNRLQHQMQPFLTYSYIPWIDQDPNHPFTRQLLRQGGLFDQYDIVPLSNSSDFLRVPEGNSIYYGFTSRLIRHLRTPEETPKSYPYDLVKKKPKEYPAPENKKEELSINREKAWDQYGPHYGDYQDIWDVTASQAFDFKEAKILEEEKQNKKLAFSYLLARSDLNVDNFSHNLEYKFYPRIQLPASDGSGRQTYISKYSLSNNLTWYLNHMTNFHGTRTFIRKISLGYSSTNIPTQISRSVGGDIYWSLNDFFAVSYARSMDLIAHTRLDQTIKTIFSSPSECWAFAIRYSQNLTTGTYFGIDLGLNLFGTGYVSAGGPGSNTTGGPGAFTGGQ